MRRAVLYFFALLFLSGCFETNFNFKTTIHRNGAIEREVQINGRGADRFLAPEGPQWEIKAVESQPGPSLLGGMQHRIHAKGRFANSSLFTSDFRYAVSSLTANLTEEKRKELRDELKVPEPFDQEIGTSNQIELKRKRSLFVTAYSYQEVFQIRHLIAILLHDLKKELALVQTAAQGQADAQTKEVSGENAAPPSPAEVEALARKRMIEEILPKFQFHSEVTLPGKVVKTNANQIHERTAVWDFRAADFTDQFSSYTLEVVSRAPNIGLISASVLALLAILWAFFFTRRKGHLTKSSN
ncbi:MAG: hypothetical protein HY584_06420 [Candidatus Omnitrophica bacterium]|nr:hypothetical protein [Candidatus Omnitrophota bacterium]